MKNKWNYNWVYYHMFWENKIITCVWMLNTDADSFNNTFGI